MIKVCLNDLAKFPEDFFLAKADIEKLLIENKEIEEKMSYEDFILYLGIQNKVYLIGSQIIAFNVLKGKNDDYLFYSYTTETSSNEILESLEQRLTKIKYDFSKLTKVSMNDFSGLDLDNPNLFVINQEFYK